MNALRLKSNDGQGGIEVYAERINGEGPFVVVIAVLGIQSQPVIVSLDTQWARQVASALTILADEVDRRQGL